MLPNGLFFCYFYQISVTFLLQSVENVLLLLTDAYVKILSVANNCL